MKLLYIIMEGFQYNFDHHGLSILTLTRPTSTYLYYSGRFEFTFGRYISILCLTKPMLTYYYILLRKVFNSTYTISFQLWLLLDDINLVEGFQQLRLQPFNFNRAFCIQFWPAVVNIDFQLRNATSESKHHFQP